MKHTTTLRRHASPEIDPSQACALNAAHPALAGAGRTIFPTTVVAPMQSPRLLVSGHNNPKLGKEVLKGERTGWPIFHLTLEERATCPRSCEQWASCYGNAMPQTRRHAVDEQFLPVLVSEVLTLARQYPKGLLVRLHALGDFYSVEYVYAWAKLLADLPQLHVFGYTARRVDDADPASADIARAIKVLTDHRWDRFAIRTSASDDIARSRSIVVNEDPDEPDIIVCPAQTGATEACATCGLCWAGAARDKTIAFLRHGMRRSRGPRIAVDAPEPAEQEAPTPLAPVAVPPRATLPFVDRRKSAGMVAASQKADEDLLYGAIEALAGEGDEATASLSVLSQASGVPNGSVLFVARRLREAGRIEVRKNVRAGSNRPQPNTYRLLGRALTVTKPNIGEMPADFDGPEIPRSIRAPNRPAIKLRDPTIPAEPAAAPEIDLEPADPVQLEIEPPATPAQADSILGLKAGQCRWPLNSPRAGDGHLTKFCRSRSLEHSSYCAEHEDAALARTTRS